MNTSLQRFSCPKCHRYWGGDTIPNYPIVSECCPECVADFPIRITESIGQDGTVKRIVTDRRGLGGIWDVDKFNDFVKQRDEFSFSTFGSPETRGPIYPLRHLAKEVQELLANPDDEMEWADCFLLLLDAARRKGYSVDDLMNFALKKLEINRERKWNKQPDGTYRHEQNSN